MKRKLAILLIAAMTISLSGCKKNDLPEPIPDEITSIEEENEVTEVEEEKKEIVTGVNLIPSGDFSDGIDKWSTYAESGGNGTISCVSKQLKATVLSTGKVVHGFQVYHDGFELISGGKYEMSFDISSSVDRTIEWRIQYNGGDYHAYIEQTGIAITPEMTTVTCEFTMNEGSDPAPRLCFNLGDKDGAQGLDTHEIYIDNVSLILTDASGCDVEVKASEQVDINLNQLGYRPNDTKRAVFRDFSKDSTFEIVNEKGETVYTGKVEGENSKGRSDEKVAYGDFSEFKEPGTYYIKAANSGSSYSFTIAKDVYDDSLDSITRMLYLQRCGTELTKEYAQDFAHTACHTQKALLYENPSVSIDVSGGWHDAGDYGRYTVAGAKAVADILLAFERYPNTFSDNTGIPESGNKTPDILDEARYELEWMLKMQASDGGVYHKVTGLNFESIAMPQDCNDQLYVLPVSKTATADFAAVMYMASRIYSNYDAAFAKKCLSAANKTLPALESMAKKRNYENPEDVLTGEYGDTTSVDEYLWAFCEGYKTTGDTTLANKIKNFNFDKLSDGGLGWANNSGYAYYAYLTSNQDDLKLSYDIRSAFLKMADEAKKNATDDAYGSSIINDYPWGSNMTICNNGIVLLMAADITGDKSYLEPARKQFDYIFGCNTNSYSFVTGIGDYCPENPHHRPSQSLGKCMPGMLVGGPDSNLEDPYAKAVLKDQPKAHCYVDSDQTYSCNEITIYWNSPLVYLMAGIMNN